VVTPQILINYAHLLEEHKHFEDSFRVYEKGVNAFEWPLSKELWIAYLSKFVKRYEGKKMERARDLFEQALGKIPPEETRPIFLMYAQLEEDHGLVKNAMAIYDRACKQVSPPERHDLYIHYINKATEFFGVGRWCACARARACVRACVCVCVLHTLNQQGHRVRWGE
jgi:pre-mRNA-splicing factor SYF1